MIRLLVLFSIIFSTFLTQSVPAIATFEKAIFAGGCFWCMEKPFDQLPGVVSTTSGYIDGHTENPTYKEVSAGTTGHTEAVQIEYDPGKVSYARLLEVFWRNIDPVDAGGQFVDRGSQYRSGIYWLNEKQKNLAELSRKTLAKRKQFKGLQIATEIKKAKTFYKAEDYHQDYYKKNPVRYRFYRYNSGRDKRLKELWGKDNTKILPTEDKKVNETNESVSTKTGRDTASAKNWRNCKKPSDAELKKQLTPQQYKITQKDGTERAGTSELNNNKAEGIYVDIVCGEPLFSSKHKYDSGTGWPSFYQPLVKEHIVEKEDRKLFSVRTEVRSKISDSHLGHVFTDGPQPTGLRYCINGVALRFVPKEKMAEEGYGEFLEHFE